MNKRDTERAERIRQVQERRAKEARWNRNSNARYKREEKKFLAARQREISALIGALKHLRNENQNERDNAARMVEVIRARMGVEWEALIR